MIPTSNEYKSRIASSRQFHIGGTITLANSTVLNLTDDEVMMSGFSNEDSVSGQTKFELGSAIINQCSITLNNVGGKYDLYDFTGAVIRPTVGLQLSASIEYLSKGVFIVDKPSVIGSTIVLTGLDYMSKFDTPFSAVSATFPITNVNLLSAVCSHCGVTLSTTTFVNSGYTISERPVDTAITCREVVSAIAQLAGSFARVNRLGQLEIKWFDFSVFGDLLDGGVFDVGTPSYVTGDIVDGGDFTFTETTNYDGGNFTDLGKFHHIYNLSSSSISTDYITITGIQVIRVKDNENYLYGTTGYVLSINNILINSGTTQSVATTLGNILNGMVFRPLSVSALSDPSIEAGDVAYVSDRKGNSYQTLITTIQYKIGAFETFRCDAETVSEQQSVQYTAEEKAVVIVNEQINTTVNETYITGKLIVSGIDADVIDVTNLVVGGNVAMGANATISWSKVTDQPTIPTVPSYITSTKITATTIESPTISAGTINGTTINGALITANIIEGSATNGTMHILKVSMLNGVVSYPNGTDFIDARYGITGNDGRYIITFNQPSPISQYQTVFGSTSYPTSIVGNSIFINGANPLTSDNYTSYTYPVPSHTHDRITFGSQEFVGVTNAVRATIDTGDGVLNLGTSSIKMNTIYASVGTINTSDRNEKNSISISPEIFKQFILKLIPSIYKLNNGTSNRFHIGFIAQDIESLMIELGIDSSEFGGFIKSPMYAELKEDGEPDESSEIIGYRYGLRYEEFIAPMVQVIQEQNDEISKLKARLSKIEELLGIVEV